MKQEILLQLPVVVQHQGPAAIEVQDDKKMSSKHHTSESQSSPNQEVEDLLSPEKWMEEHREGQTTRRRRHATQVLLFLGVSVSFVTQLGMNLTWPNVLAGQLSSHNATAATSTLLGPDLQLAPWQVDLTGSSVQLGSLPGYLAAGWLVHRVGRRWSMLLATVPGLLGWSLLAFASHSITILTARFITGLAMGLTTVSVRTYLVEIADPEIRGMAGLIASAMLEFGCVLTISLGMVMTWYNLAFVVVGILFFFCLLLPLLPESPTHLVLTKREDKARNVLRRLRDRRLDLDKEVKLIKAHNQELNQGGSWSLLFTQPVSKNIMVSVGIFFVSHFCGTEVIRANATRMLMASNLDMDKDICTILVFIVSFCGIITMMLVIDRIGRRQCLVISLLLLVVAYTVLGTRLHLSTLTIPTQPATLESSLNHTIGPTQPVVDYNARGEGSWVSLVFLLLAALAIGLGVGPLPWVIAPELFPTVIRSQAMSACTILSCLLAFLPLQLYSLMQEELSQAGLYWTYGFVSGLGIIYTILCVPETGKREVW